MDEPTIEEWMDRHHVEIVRTQATTLDGLGVGKYLGRKKFLDSLPNGHAISDMALAGDPSGTPHLTFWHDFRHAEFGDILLRPDIDTLIWDGTDPDLGHCICDFVDAAGSEIPLCPRTLLKEVYGQVQALGYQAKAAFELEFFLYRDSFEQARRRGYKNLDPVTASTQQNIYLLRNAHHAKPFMNEVIKRLNWQRVAWESWSDEGGVGQVELNFPPADPISAADTIVRARQLIYEVAADLGLSVTFMASLSPGYGNGLHVHHSLQEIETTNIEPNADDAEAAAFLSEGNRSPLLMQWIAGITKTMPGATSLLCPSYNGYRRLQAFSSPPVTPTWGEENKTAGLRVISRTPKSARIEHRLPGGDANPYLVLATIFAGGLAGVRHNLSPPPELKHVGWGMPEDVEKLPNNIMAAADALAADTYLAESLGQGFIDYWINTRKLEWLNFHNECGDTDSKVATDWELRRNFELI